MKTSTSIIGYSLILLGCMALVACTTAHRSCSGGILSGRIYWSEGNFMPNPSGDHRAEPVPVERKLVVHELTDMDGVDRTEGPLYERIRSPRVAVLQADSDGTFWGCLPPGEYSVFTVEEGGFFANRFDGAGHIQPVSILAGDTTSIVIDINYKAYY